MGELLRSKTLIAQGFAAKEKPALGQTIQPQQRTSTPKVLPGTPNATAATTGADAAADEVEYQPEEEGADKIAQGVQNITAISNICKHAVQLSIRNQQCCSMILQLCAS
jgi:hypothetical protein